MLLCCCPYRSCWVRCGIKWIIISLGRGLPLLVLLNLVNKNKTPLALASLAFASLSIAYARFSYTRGSIGKWMPVCNRPEGATGKGCPNLIDLPCTCLCPTNGGSLGKMEGASGPLQMPMPDCHRPALQLPMPVKWRENRGNGGSIGKMKWNLKTKGNFSLVFHRPVTRGLAEA